MNEYVHSQRPKSITAVINHTIVASQVNFQGGKKPSQGKETGEQKGKGAQTQNASKVTIAKKTKNQEKGYKGKARLSLEQMEQYRKENKCFKCGEIGHVSRVCPTKSSNRMELPRLLQLKS